MHWAVGLSTLSKFKQKILHTVISKVKNAKYTLGNLLKSV